MLPNFPDGYPTTTDKIIILLSQTSMINTNYDITVQETINWRAVE